MGSFARLLSFYITFLFATTFLRAVVPPYILSQGIGIRAMLIGLIVVFSAQISMFFLFQKRQVYSRNSWFLGLIFVLVSVALVINVKTDVQYYLSALFNGLNLFFFWVFYNTTHFENVPKGKVGFFSGIMFGIPSLIGVIAPFIAGALGEINIWIVWITSSLSLILAIVLIKLQVNFSLTFDIKKSFIEIKATRLLIFLSGLWDSLVTGVIPIYTLFFIKTTLGYGTFLSYLSLVSVLATLIIGRLSDKLNKRIIFLYPVTLTLALATFGLTLANQNLTIWAILSGIISFLLPIFWNLSTAIVVDNSSNLKLAFQGRELILASGRIIGFIVVFAAFNLEERPFFIYIFLGTAMLLFTMVLFWKSKISKNHVYL